MATALLPIGLSEQPGVHSRLSGYDLWSRGTLRPAPLSRGNRRPRRLARYSDTHRPRRQ